MWVIFQALHDHSQREDLITEMYLRANRDKYFVPWVQGTQLCDLRGFTLPIAKVVIDHRSSNNHYQTYYLLIYPPFTYLLSILFPTDGPFYYYHAVDTHFICIHNTPFVP